MVPRKRSMLSSSKRARVIDEKKSTPSKSESISMEVCVDDERVRLARSHAVRRRRMARGLEVMSFLCLRLNSWTKWLTVRLSKSSPPRWVSPAVALTSKMPSSIVSSDTSKVPPPRSKMSTLRAEDVEAGDRAGVLGGGALRVVEVRRHRHHRVGHVLAEVGLGGLLHLDEDHRRDLLGEEGLLLALVLDDDGGAVALLGDDLEGEVLQVRLGRRVRELAADQALGVEDGVLRVHGGLVLGRVADHALRLREGDERGRGAVALVVGDDLDAVVLPDADARVRGAEVNAHGRSLNLAVLAHFIRCLCLVLFRCGWCQCPEG